MIMAANRSLNRAGDASWENRRRFQGKQAASLVDKILKGTPVNQFPIETPHLREPILNLDTAKEIGVKFPQEMINRADEVIGEVGKRL
jgi:ABC-type uncharacterized transport system substrate-binding protein